MRTPFADFAASSRAARLTPYAITMWTARSASHIIAAADSPQAKPFTAAPPASSRSRFSFRLNPSAARAAKSGADGRMPKRPTPKYQNAKQQNIAPTTASGRNATAYTTAMPKERPHSARRHLLPTPHPFRQLSHTMKLHTGTSDIASCIATLPVSGLLNASSHIPVQISMDTAANGSATPNMNVVTGCARPLHRRAKNPSFFSVVSIRCNSFR